MTNETKEQRIKHLRIALMASMCGQMSIFINNLSAQVGNVNEKEAGLEIMPDIILLTNLLDNLCKEGSPEELLFITTSGKKIDLKKEMEFDFNTMMDSLMDEYNEMIKKFKP